jgi:predicted LPLAT superfamily acyltransferase
MGNEPPGGNHDVWHTRRQIGSKFQHSIFYVTIRIGGRSLAYALLSCVVAYYVLFSPLARTRASFYLRRRFPQKNRVARLLDCYRLCLELGKVLIDRAAVGIIGPSALRGKLVGLDVLRKIRNEGKGMILLTSHVGCWQAAMSALGDLQRPVHLLMRREDGELDRHYYEHTGTSCPYGIIDPSGYLGGALEMTGALGRGEIVCIMGDRVFGNDANAVEMDFLGDKALFPVSAFRLASATGAPVIVLFSSKTGHDTFEVSAKKIIRVPGNIGRRGKGTLRSYIRQYTDSLESYIETNPYQFFNFYDMWRR